MWWIIIGIAAGALAKALMPGGKREPQGCLLTMLLGIAGSVIFGWIWRNVFGEHGGGGMLGTIVGATIGAMLLLWLARKLSK